MRVFKWRETNFEAQIEQMKKAGLNPAMMYAQGGQGGQSTTSGGGNQSGQPFKDPQLMGIGMQTAVQMQQSKAQIDLMKAQAEKTKAEANKISGVDTEETKGKIANLTQDIHNKKALEEYHKIQTKLGELTEYEQWMSQDDRMRQFKWTADKLIAETRSANATAEVDEKTAQTKIDIVKQELVNMGVQKELMTAQKQLNQKQVVKLGEEISKMWAEYHQENRRIENDKQRSDAQTMATRNEGLRIQMEAILKNAGLDLERDKATVGALLSIFSTVAGGTQITNNYN